VSLAGDWFAFVAVSGMVTELTGREGIAAIVYAATVLPMLFVSPIAGVVADRFDRRRTLVTANIVCALPALGLVAALHLSSAVLAIACMLLLAVFATFVEPAVGAGTPNLVDREDLPLAQTMMGAVWGSMLFVGAALGGLVTHAFGRQTAFLIDAGSFLLAAALVAGIRRPFQVGPRAAAASLWSHVGEVIALARRRAIVRALLVVKTGVGLANGIVGLLPAYALVAFGAGDAGIGALLAARGFGALIGPFFGRALVRGDGRRLLVVCGCAILSYATAYAFLPLTTSLWAAMACVALAHAGGGAQWVLSTYGLQVAVDDRIRGRVLSLDFGLATFAIGVSSLGAGALAEAIGVRHASWTLVVLGLIYGATWLFFTRPLWRSNIDPLAPDPDGGARGGRSPPST
jgi:MFS family permease